MAELLTFKHTLDICIGPDLHEKDVQWSEGGRKQEEECVWEVGVGGGGGGGKKQIQ